MILDARASNKYSSMYAMWWLMSACALWAVCAPARAQSNYAAQANDIEYQGTGLPEQTLLDGKVTKLDDLSPVIFLNRTKAALNCAAGSMQVELKFNEKFYGIAYADFDRHSACQLVGKGALSYKLELPLKGCGTKQDPLRVFTNNIVVRFHPGLEMDGDEVITIVCRYPPPITPLVPAIPERILNVPPQARAPPLQGLHILLIICAVLFLTLVLLGLAASYLCLRRRSLPVLARVHSGSEITKLSGSSADITDPTVFSDVKIPRAHAPYAAGGRRSSASSDTLPSDYPSETPSEAGSPVSHDNRAYQRDNLYQTDGYGERSSAETLRTNAAAAASAGAALQTATPPPAFDVQVRVRRPPPAPPSPQPSTATLATTTDNDVASIRNITSIEPIREESVRTMSPIPVPTPTLALPPRQERTPPRPPIYSQVRRDPREWQDDEEEDELIPVPPRRPRSILSLNTEMTDTHSVTELLDHTHAKMFALKKPAPPPPPPLLIQQEEMQMESLETMEAPPETPIMPARKPELSSHVVDDVFLRTITSKRTIEETERHRRRVTRHEPPPPAWDVTIRQHRPGAQPAWEDFSDVSSASGVTLTPKMGRAASAGPAQPFIGETGPHLFSPALIKQVPGAPLPELPPARNPLYRDEQDADVPPPAPPHPIPYNWDTLTRVLRTEAMDEVLSEHESSYRLTHSERVRWREIIGTSSSLREQLTRAVSHEEFSSIARDERYNHLFEPVKWEVIMRIIAPPPLGEKPRGGRYRKKWDSDTRSRRSSLPTLYEGDSDAPTSRATSRASSRADSGRGRRSSYRSDHNDMRSMSEMMVEYSRLQDGLDSQSSVSGGATLARYADSDSDGEHDYPMPGSSSHRSLQRSISQPSLARSASEFTERWGVASQPQDDGEDSDVTPTPHRRHPPANQTMSTFTSSEVRTFQATRDWHH